MLSIIFKHLVKVFTVKLFIDLGTGPRVLLIEEVSIFALLNKYRLDTEKF